MNEDQLHVNDDKLYGQLPSHVGEIYTKSQRIPATKPVHAVTEEATGGMKHLT